MNKNKENWNLSIIAALRVWRNADHEDAITLHRNEIIRLLKEIDDTRR